MNNIDERHNILINVQHIITNNVQRNMAIIVQHNRPNRYTIYSIIFYNIV